jgi:hypothetical protein
MEASMGFDKSAYGPGVARLLSLGGDGNHLMPLTPGTCSSNDARVTLQTSDLRSLFPGSYSPQGALAGLWLYFSCLDEAHSVAQCLETAEGCFWHGIMHRREPDAWNSSYWFRRVGRHEVFPALRDAAARLAAKRDGARFSVGQEWDPFRFIEFAEEALLASGSETERLALEIQLAEWQLLFDYCARPCR